MLPSFCMAVEEQGLNGAWPKWVDMEVQVVEDGGLSFHSRVGHCG